MHYVKSLMMKQKKDKRKYSLKQLDFSTQRLCRNFDCGNEYINGFIRDTAIDDVDSTTFIYIDNTGNKVVCAYSLACSGIVANISNKTLIYPAVEIKVFALDKEYQHKVYNKSVGTYGDLFFSYIIRSIAEFTDNYCGASRIVLYSVPEYINFYKRNFFKNFEPFMNPDESETNRDCIPMFFNF